MEGVAVTVMVLVTATPALVLDVEVVDFFDVVNVLELVLVLFFEEVLVVFEVVLVFEMEEAVLVLATIPVPFLYTDNLTAPPQNWRASPAHFMVHFIAPSLSAAKVLPQKHSSPYSSPA
jgi:hypothetical protein